MNLPRITFFLSFILVYACHNGPSGPDLEREIELNETYQDINTIISVAACTGPSGSYSTEVHSTRDGYTYFIQSYEDRGEDFEVVLPDSNTGFLVTGDSEIGDPVPKMVRDIVRGHEFHKISLFPESYFSNLAFSKNASFDDKECELFLGIDPTGNQARVFYNKNEKQLKGFELLNPGDTSEVIRVIHKTWQESNFGKMIKYLEVVQGERDTFTFSFEPVLINSETFQKIMGVQKGHLLKAVHDFNTAFREGNIDALDSMVTENYQHTNGNSRVIDKQNWFNYLKKRKNDIDAGQLVIEDYKMDQTRVELNGNMAIVTARISVTSISKGVQSENQYRITNTWKKEDGSWKRAGFHDGRIK